MLSVHTGTFLWSEESFSFLSFRVSQSPMNVHLIIMFRESIPTYDTMNRFPRASAPPRHIDWWQSRLLFWLLKVPSKTGTEIRHTFNFLNPWTRWGSVKAGFLTTKEQLPCRRYLQRWTEPSRPSVRLQPAGYQTPLPSASIWARLVLHFL